MVHVNVVDETVSDKSSLFFFVHTFLRQKMNCFTGQPPSNAISITAALHVHEKLGPKSMPQFFVGGLGLGWLAAAGAGAF